jgi:hypothetical protein
MPKLSRVLLEKEMEDIESLESECYDDDDTFVKCKIHDTYYNSYSDECFDCYLKENDYVR